MADERLLTVRQAAEHFQVRTETILRWIKAGRIHGTMVGGTRSGYRITEREILRVLGEGRAASQEGET